MYRFLPATFTTSTAAGLPRNSSLSSVPKKTPSSIGTISGFSPNIDAIKEVTIIPTIILIAIFSAMVKPLISMRIAETLKMKTVKNPYL